ncbi:hypothetical protein LMG33818_002134 [Halomonadaceae bacterium LMG 33818]|uniref:DNA-processing protein DprA n=1 Tax=Cernens ardua TaxID=3402176 RepID=UPI003EDC35AC
MAKQVSMGPREWLALSLVPRLGSSRIHTLYQQGVQWPGAWLAQLGLAQRQYLVYLLEHTAGQAQVDEILAWCDESRQRYLLYPGHPAWPALLEEIPDPPVLLWAWGNLSLLNQRGLAMVGSRQASARGMQHAHHFAHVLAEHGLCIVSGMALGIDAAAHTGALEGKGATLAVLGCGIDILYPRRHAALRQQILDGAGLVVSEFPPGTKAYPQFFPRRNRIITGLSEGVLVVEATKKSGSLISARLALEQNRDVYALPGAADDEGMSGCHWLIQQGAMLVAHPRDMIEAMALEGSITDCNSPPAALHCAAHRVSRNAVAPFVSRRSGEESSLVPCISAITGCPVGTASPTPDIKHINGGKHESGIGFSEMAVGLYHYLSHTPVGLDALVTVANTSCHEGLIALLELEIGGVISRVPGGWVHSPD